MVDGSEPCPEFSRLSDANPWKSGHLGQTINVFAPCVDTVNETFVAHSLRMRRARASDEQPVNCMRTAGVDSVHAASAVDRPSLAHLVFRWVWSRMRVARTSFDHGS